MGPDPEILGPGPRAQGPKPEKSAIFTLVGIKIVSTRYYIVNICGIMPKKFHMKILTHAEMGPM